MLAGEDHTVANLEVAVALAELLDGAYTFVSGDNR